MTDSMFPPPVPMLHNVYRPPIEGFRPTGSSPLSWSPSSNSNKASNAIPKSFLVRVIPQFVKILAEYSFHMSHFDTRRACEVLKSSSSDTYSPSSTRIYDADTSSGLWDRLVAPFVLLAAAKELEFGFGYILQAQQNEDTMLTGLYLRIQMELRKLKEILGIPAPPPALDEQMDHSDDTFISASMSLMYSIECVMEICKVQCKLIDLHCHIFCKRSAAAQVGIQQAANVITQLGQSFNNAIQTMESTSPLPLEDMVDSLKRDLDLWHCLFETYSALERCAFAPTLLKLKKWQELLQNHLTADVVQHRWMIASHRHIVSLLPMYFDRIYTFASPLYGFDTSKLWSGAGTGQSLTSWDEHINQFLRQQDKLGYTIAISLVLETTGVDARPERGYQLSVGQGTKAEEVASASTKQWQAMYLRSTIRVTPQPMQAPSPHASGTWSSQNSVLSSLRGSHLSNLASAVNSPAIPVSRKKKIHNVKHSPSFLSRKTAPVSNESSVLEYAPEAGKVTTWPHSIWEQLSSLLHDEKVRATTAETLHGGTASLRSVVRVYHVDENPDEVDNSRKSELLSAKTSLFQFRWNEEQFKSKCLTSCCVASQLETDKSAYRGQDNAVRNIPTKVYVATISDWLRLLCIRRGSQNGLIEDVSSRKDSVREFLSDLSGKLAPMAIFQASFITSLTDTETERLEFSLQYPGTDLSLEVPGDDLLQEYLGHAQLAFGLRPESPFFESARSQGRSSGSYSPASPRRQLRKPNQMDISATSLFLGPELGSIFDQKSVVPFSSV